MYVVAAPSPALSLSFLVHRSLSCPCLHSIATLLPAEAEDGRDGGFFLCGLV